MTLFLMKLLKQRLILIGDADPKADDQTKMKVSSLNSYLLNVRYDQIWLSFSCIASKFLNAWSKFPLAFYCKALVRVSSIGSFEPMSF